MNIIIVFRQDIRVSPVEAYAHSFVRAFQKLGHHVRVVGEGQDLTDLHTFIYLQSCTFDLILEIDNGRNEAGELPFQVPNLDFSKYGSVRGTQKAVVLIDSHGHADLHKSIAPKYDHVFFAVWDKRDIFVGHPSSHWCPNITDLEWFGRDKFKDEEIKYDFGFFGSRKGLSRADLLKDICKNNGWTYDIREVVKPRRHRWPATGRAMAGCRYLFNRGQKHDGPNQRVMESMAMGRPLLNDLDPRSGMQQLFTDGAHYIGYDPSSPLDLEEKMEWLITHPDTAFVKAERAYKEVRDKHQAINRVQQILEVVNR